MTKSQKVAWVIFALLLIVFAFLTIDIVTPFIFAIIIAYCFNPLMVRLEKIGVSRGFGALIITFAFMLIVSLLLILITPILYKQTINLFNLLPEYIAIAKQNLISLKAKFASNGFISDNSLINGQNISGISGYSTSLFSYLAGSILESGLFIANLLSMIFVTPIIIFYLLKDWNKMLKSSEKTIPQKYLKTVKNHVIEIDVILSAYIRGQIMVCLILALFYSIGLSLVGLKFGFLIGFLTGIFSFIPYLGLLIGMCLGIMVALFQYGFDMVNLALVIGIFVIGQFIEGNFITPKIVGKKVGLHPVWVIFALFAGGSILGFTGILFAIPLAAIIGVLVKSFIKNFNKQIEGSV